MEVIVDVLGGKCKPGILFNLLVRPFRFAELRRQLDRISEKMLTQQLRDLEREGVVPRSDFKEQTLHVECGLTEYGRSLAPILQLMGQWGEQHAQRRSEVRPP
jgi:DNA-binding HxlR family transcriptional regulator